MKSLSMMQSEIRSMTNADQNLDSSQGEELREQEMKEDL